MPRRIESLFVNGPVGRLEAILEEPEEGALSEAALVCHPHPQHRGTMHNKVVYRIARGLRGNGAAVLRFNYRGVNLSEGEYAHGEGELEDARAALAYLRTDTLFPYTTLFRSGLRSHICASGIRSCPSPWQGFPSARASRYASAARELGRDGSSQWASRLSTMNLLTWRAAPCRACSSRARTINLARLPIFKKW